MNLVSIYFQSKSRCKCRVGCSGIKNRTKRMKGSTIRCRGRRKTRFGTCYEEQVPLCIDLSSSRHVLPEGIKGSRWRIDDRTRDGFCFVNVETRPGPAFIEAPPKSGPTTCFAKLKKPEGRIDPPRSNQQRTSSKA